MHVRRRSSVRDSIAKSSWASMLFACLLVCLSPSELFIGGLRSVVQPRRSAHIFGRHRLRGRLCEAAPVGLGHAEARNAVRVVEIARLDEPIERRRLRDVDDFDHAVAQAKDFGAREADDEPVDFVLVHGLLAQEVGKRTTAEEVLAHGWIARAAPTALPPPAELPEGIDEGDEEDEEEHEEHEAVAEAAAAEAQAAEARDALLAKFQELGIEPPKHYLAAAAPEAAEVVLV